MADPSAYRKALAERSSYVENVLTHRLVSTLAGELWRRDPTLPLNIFNAEVDDAGFDLVLGCGNRLRYHTDQAGPRRRQRAQVLGAA
jgi:hypothetical protein